MLNKNIELMTGISRIERERRVSSRLHRGTAPNIGANQPSAAAAAAAACSTNNEASTEVSRSTSVRRSARTDQIAAKTTQSSKVVQQWGY